MRGGGCGGIKPKSALSSDVGVFCSPPLIEIASWDRNNDVHVECRRGRRGVGGGEEGGEGEA